MESYSFRYSSDNTDSTEIGESNLSIRLRFDYSTIVYSLVYRLRRKRKRMLVSTNSTDTDLSVEERKRKEKKNVDQSRDIFALIKRSSSQTDRYRSCKSVVEKGERYMPALCPFPQNGSME